MDTELFELCKSVYEKTGWHDTESYINEEGVSFHAPGWYDYYISDEMSIYPLYTSDYLLEKLPKDYITSYDQEQYEVYAMPALTYYRREWRADLEGASEYDENGNSEYQGVADTPLKALLKLVLALHEAGELK